MSANVDYRRHITGRILGLHPANERLRYKVTPSLIGLAQTYNQPCIISMYKNFNLCVAKAPLNL